MNDATRALTLLVEPLAAEAGLDLENIEVANAGRRKVVRIYVDKDGGISLDDVASVSQVISGALDRADLLGGAPYVLEVSSPGATRPLTQPRHWRRALGRIVTATLVDGSSVTG